MSGPVIIHYVSKGTKKIILVGDRHESNRKCANKSVTINKHLDELFKSNIDNITIMSLAEISIGKYGVKYIS